MRLELSIPDPIYAEASRVAALSGLTIDKFISDALSRSLKDAPQEGLQLTPEHVAKVKAGLEDAKAGRVYTMDQVKEEMRAYKKAWLAENQT